MRGYAFVILLTMLNPAFAGYSEFTLIDFKTCQHFALSNLIYDENLHERAKSILNKSPSGTGILAAQYSDGRQTLGGCAGSYGIVFWEAAQFKCSITEKDFPIDSGATFEFDPKRNKWAAMCSRNCGKSSNQRLYWVDTSEHETGESKPAENLGYVNDLKSYKSQCQRKF